MKKTLMLLLTLVFLSGCSFFSKLPSDETIKKDIPSPGIDERIMDVKVKGLIVKEDLAQALVNVKVKCLKMTRDASYQYFNPFGYDVLFATGKEKEKEEVFNLNIYYCKTDRGWVNISAKEFKQQLLYKKAKQIK